MLYDLVPQLSGCSMPAMGKRCGRCGETKPMSEFSACHRYENGARLQRWCKECHRQANREWYRTRGKAMRK